MSDGLLRISEVTALQYSDVEMSTREQWGRVHVRFSKTDQTGKGTMLFLGEKTMRYLHIYMSSARIKSGPLFRRIHKARDHERVHASGLTTKTITRII